MTNIPISMYLQPKDCDKPTNPAVKDEPGTNKIRTIGNFKHFTLNMHTHSTMYIRKNRITDINQILEREKKNPVKMLQDILKRCYRKINGNVCVVFLPVKNWRKLKILETFIKNGKHVKVPFAKECDRLIVTVFEPTAANWERKKSAQDNEKTKMTIKKKEKQ